jgi:hypothetical protein
LQIIPLLVNEIQLLKKELKELKELHHWILKTAPFLFFNK